MTSNAETDVEALVQAASNFSASDVDMPWLLSFETMGYEGLLPTSDWSGFQPIVSNRQNYQLTVAPALTQLYGIWSEIQNILQIYTSYNYYADPNIGFAMRGNQQMVYSAIQELTAWLTDVAANPQQAATSPTDGSCDPLDIIAKGTPSLNYSITITPCNSSSNRSSPLWGNNNSVSFTFLLLDLPTGRFRSTRLLPLMSKLFQAVMLFRSLNTVNPMQQLPDFFIMPPKAIFMWQRLMATSTGIQFLRLAASTYRNVLM